MIAKKRTYGMVVSDELPARMPQRLVRDYQFARSLPMNPEPAVKRTIAFVDVHNLFHASQKAFGYAYPNYDAQALVAAYRDKRWVTRPHLHVDRLACIWLIRRFINPSAVLPRQRRYGYLSFAEP